MPQIKFIDQVPIVNKKVLLRVDFNVTLNPDHSLADDFRIRQSLPTIKYLLQNKNKIILVSHLDRPKKRDPKYSLKPVVKDFQKYFPSYKIILTENLNPKKEPFVSQKQNEIIFLENIRFWPEEQKNDPSFAKKLAGLADVFVNDAFGVSHRANASVVGVPKYLPSYGGLLLKKEIETISKAIENPKHPFVAIIGGAKISTKIALIDKLLEISDYLLIGGGLANTFLCAQGINIGNSFCEYEKVSMARKLLFKAAQRKVAIVLPEDVIVGDPENEENGGKVLKVEQIHDGEDGAILDIGPETQAKFAAIIAKSKTIIWNGPVGYIENPAFRRGTDFIYYCITQNPEAISIVGGGDTLAAISKKEYLDKITHISTGGGAMLEFIEKGTLPGIEALKS